MKIYAPFAGIVHYHVATGDVITTGQKLASVEATKLEAAVIAQPLVELADSSEPATLVGEGK